MHGDANSVCCDFFRVHGASFARTFHVFALVARPRRNSERDSITVSQSGVAARFDEMTTCS